MEPVTIVNALATDITKLMGSIQIDDLGGEDEGHATYLKNGGLFDDMLDLAEYAHRMEGILRKPYVRHILSSNPLPRLAKLVDQPAQPAPLPTPEPPLGRIALGNRDRQRILDHVRAHPGSTIPDLRVALDLARPSAYAYVNELVELGQLTYTGRRPARYYLPGTAEEKPTPIRRPYQRGGAGRKDRVLDWVRANPGHTLREIAQACGLSLQNSYHLCHELSDAGALTIEGRYPARVYAV